MMASWGMPCIGDPARWGMKGTFLFEGLQKDSK